MRRPLPLNALRVFEVAARTGSYAQAGAELGLTHGAVSRQIALLESWLGQRLFVRTGRRMTATPAARAFAAEVSLSFDRMTAAAEACGRPSARHLLRVSAPTTFALRWLIPRLESFHGQRPEVEVAGDNDDDAARRAAGRLRLRDPPGSGRAGRMAAASADGFLVGGRYFDRESPACSTARPFMTRAIS